MLGRGMSHETNDQKLSIALLDSFEKQTALLVERTNLII